MTMSGESSGAVVVMMSAAIDVAVIFINFIIEVMMIGTRMVWMRAIRFIDFDE